MAFGVVVDDLGEGGGDWVKETEVIPEGTNVCRLVSYIELGHHNPVFMGKRAKYDQGKNVGKDKPDEMLIHLVFEFPACPYSGDFPLSIKTSAPYGKLGDVGNKLHVSKSLEEGWASKSIAMKMKFVKALLAMQAAKGVSHPSMLDFVGEGFCCSIKHNLGKKADDDGNIPVYANMDLTSLASTEFKHPVTGKVEVIEVPDTIGEYCHDFIWDDPTLESWTEVPKYLKTFIKTAVDFPGSKLNMMLKGFVEEPGENHKEPESTPPVNTGGPAQADDIPA